MTKELDNIVIDGLEEVYGTNVDVDDVLSAKMVLIDFRIDGSGSMEPYESAMQDCLKHYKNALCNSKQSDEMMVAKTVFNRTIYTGGYVAPEDFDTDYTTGGITRLYDSIIDGRKRMLDYIEQLRNSGTQVQAYMVILSDGEDIGSTNHIGDARQAIKDLTSKEITVAFIAFGQDAFGVADKLGINPKNVMEVNNDESELRHIINQVSKSAISASKYSNAGVAVPDSSGFFDI